MLLTSLYFVNSRPLDEVTRPNTIEKKGDAVVWLVVMHYPLWCECLHTIIHTLFSYDDINDGQLSIVNEHSVSQNTAANKIIMVKLNGIGKRALPRWKISFGGNMRLIWTGDNYHSKHHQALSSFSLIPWVSTMYKDYKNKILCCYSICELQYTLIYYLLLLHNLESLFSQLDWRKNSN